MVRNRPFHLLSRNRHRYVIVIEEMRAQAVDDDTAALLEPLIDETNPALPSDLVKRLAALDLIADEKEGAGKQGKKELPPIVNMALFLTQSCNLRCIYCYGNGGGYGSGGNLNEKTAAFHITTNATLLDDEKIGFIEKFSIDTSVSIEEDAETWIEFIKTRDLPGVVKLKHSSPLYHGLTCFLHHVKKRYPCGAGLGKVGVSCLGDVYLCHRFVGVDAYKLGTVFNTDLDREIYQQPPVTRVDECRRCIAGFYCAGGCKHDNAGANGSIFKPSRDMCRLKRREMEMAAYVVSLLDDGDRDFLGREDIVPPKPCPLDFG